MSSSVWIGTAYCKDCGQIVDVYLENDKTECGFCGKDLKLKIEEYIND